MKLRIVLSLILALSAGWLPARAAAADDINIAVYDFTDADKNGHAYADKVTALITADLTTESNLVLLERADLNKALKEQAIGISGMVNADQAAKIGQLTGVKALVSGQIIRTGKDRLVIVANIVSTESGRLFAEKVEGPTDNFSDLTTQLSQKIAQNIRDHASSFVHEVQSHDAYIDRIVKSVAGTNRPSISVDFHFPRGVHFPAATANSEMGLILQKAGFTVVDSHSDHKPDVEITGIVDSDIGPKRGQMFSARTVIEAKVMERRAGKIITVDRQIGDAVDIGKMTANRNAQARATDALAERIVPLLAQ